VSFTFDDFPVSAFAEGGRILNKYGARGTYFVSLRLLGTSGVSGQIASSAHLADLVKQGHELGCHTFDHIDGSESTVGCFEQSIEKNREALAACVPGAVFRTFAYPLNGPTLQIKRAIGNRFVGCRGGGQTFNSRVIDLNLLKAYFLDFRTRDNLRAISAVIDENAATRGWLIFATHDVGEEPSKYGCSSSVFEQAVQLSLGSGARVLPVKHVLQELDAIS
jgi:peptidoglycan/xylan/chitin deacetylase (PgdA/CDA1 family)